ncbi:Bacterial type II secretion system protein F domain protein [Roseivivax sp. THAF40]|uniref:type II secretion system F family protein n=1 Tax=unclassified Roseivivax TaxID=2639302 RepID=UPI0012683897|nr:MULTISPECIES: type II secretion system F family protein [unclassified Roseivivax]QFS83741.1 Bacterial type II secretion system protein F domain protein [Roseivivax sp. THAF197b]QFT47543.1 Bacterial type II secretion system protein F domain protein [Roseivivax sp. THAF40]
MFETLTPTIFWPAFCGLVLSVLGFAALLHNERQRERLTLRLNRANGTAPARHLHQTRRQSGSLAHAGRKLHGIVVQMGERLSIILGGEARETAMELASAGYRGRDALLIYAFLKTVLPLIVVVLGTIWVLSSRSFGLQMVLPAAGVIAAALAVSKCVDAVVSRRRKARLARIRRGFPDMLELLVISSEAGLGPQPALHRVAHELAAISPELAREILQMVSEMHMTNDRRAAYDKLNIRVPLPEFGVFTQTLDQSDTYGTPFSKAMRTLITEQRANRLIAIEEKAARLPVIMTMPLIFCIMPAVFVVLVGPAALSIFDNIISGG